MMGVVPVQVRGSVAANEALYASVDNPGLAISGHHLDISAIKDSIFIGYAFSSRKTDDEDSVSDLIALLWFILVCSDVSLKKKYVLYPPGWICKCWCFCIGNCW